MENILEEYVSLTRNLVDVYANFYAFLRKTARENPNRIIIEGRHMEMGPIAPTEMRLERMHIVLEIFGRRDAFRYLERMLKENIRATRAYLNDVQQQRNAIRDAIVKGLSSKSPEKKRPRPSGMRARHMLDYGTLALPDSSPRMQARKPSEFVLCF